MLEGGSVTERDHTLASKYSQYFTVSEADFPFLKDRNAHLTQNFPIPSEPLCHVPASQSTRESSTVVPSPTEKQEWKISVHSDGREEIPYLG
jgi:hypothetical protein